MIRPFHIVDVFAERPCSGNQLAVVLNADGLSDEAMQSIAAETNYSETTFVASTPERDGAFRVRIFTPAREVAFAGHPILGTGWVIQHHLLPGISAHVHLRIATGSVPVTFESSGDGREIAWFRAPPVSLGSTCPREPIAAALGVPATGNGAAFLGAYLLEHRAFPGADLILRIEQGFEIRRPSLVLLRARMVEDAREVSVGGRVIPIVRGELL